METQTLLGHPQNALLPCIANIQPSRRVQAAKYNQCVLRPSESVEARKIEARNTDMVTVYLQTELEFTKVTIFLPAHQSPVLSRPSLSMILLLS